MKRGIVSGVEILNRHVLETHRRPETLLGLERGHRRATAKRKAALGVRRGQTRTLEEANQLRHLEKQLKV